MGITEITTTAGSVERSDVALWAVAQMRRQSTRRVATLLAALLALVLVIALAGALVSGVDVQSFALVRSGGGFDSRTMRRVMMLGKGLAYIGLGTHDPHDFQHGN